MHIVIYCNCSTLLIYPSNARQTTKPPLHNLFFEVTIEQEEHIQLFIATASQCSKSVASSNRMERFDVDIHHEDGNVYSSITSAIAFPFGRASDIVTSHNRVVVISDG